MISRFSIPIFLVLFSFGVFVSAGTCPGASQFVNVSGLPRKTTSTFGRVQEISLSYRTEFGVYPASENSIVFVLLELNSTESYYRKKKMIKEFSIPASVENVVVLIRRSDLTIRNLNIGDWLFVI